MIAAESITREEARALLSVLTALLAAYGFFYTGVKEGLADAAKTEWADFRSKRDLRPSLKEATDARNTLVILAVCANTVTVLFVPVALEVLKDVDLRAPYSAEKAALLLLEMFWTALAAIMLRRALGLASHVGGGKERERILSDV